jgi:hypothetical protein
MGHALTKTAASRAQLPWPVYPYQQTLFGRKPRRSKSAIKTPEQSQREGYSTSYESAAVVIIFLFRHTPWVKSVSGVARRRESAGPLTTDSFAAAPKMPALCHVQTRASQHSPWTGNADSTSYLTQLGKFSGLSGLRRHHVRATRHATR